MTFRFPDLVGTYRLVVTEELVAFVERTFVEAAAPEDRDEIRAQALHEAAGAELEITADGFAISRAHGQEFHRTALEVDDGEHDEVSYEKAPGSPVRLALADLDTLLAHQPNKPVSEFKRVRAVLPRARATNAS